MSSISLQTGPGQALLAANLKSLSMQTCPGCLMPPGPSRMQPPGTVWSWTPLQPWTGTRSTRALWGLTPYLPTPLQQMWTCQVRDKRCNGAAEAEVCAVTADDLQKLSL